MVQGPPLRIPWWRILLGPFAFLYQVASFLHRRFHPRPRCLNRPVISVGNLSMGGTGKTPVVSGFIQMAEQFGLRAAVLSRGYGRRSVREVRRVTPGDAFEDVGDEPLMLARRHPKALVYVGRSRYAAGVQAEVEDPELFFLDDGFQHWSLARDADVVLLDVTQGVPAPVPMGRFREGWSALKRADLVVLTRCPVADRAMPFRRAISRVNPELLVVRSWFELQSPVSLCGGDAPSFSGLQGLPLAAFCAIGHPESFFSALREHDLRLVKTWAFRDHRPLTSERLKAIVDECQARGIQGLLTTEKDAVKLAFPMECDIFLGFLPVTLQWEDEFLVQQWLSRILNERKRWRGQSGLGERQSVDD